MGEILLETKKLSKHFGGIIANEKIDFSIDRGEIVAIIGPNGSGKTTFYNLLTGITPSTSGSIWFEGKNITKKKPEQITKLGISRTFQNIRLFGGMTVAENILVARHCRTCAGLLDAVVNSEKKRKEEAGCCDIVAHCMDYVGILTIPSLELELPVASVWSYPALQLAPCRFTGSAYTDDLVIAGHNYTSHFADLHSLQQGDLLSFTDVDGNVFAYRVAETEILGENDVEEMTGSGYALTLFSCTVGGQYRVTVRCERI